MSALASSAERFGHPWPLVRMGDVCNIRRGSTLTKNKAQNGNIPVIAGGIGPAYFHNASNRPAGMITVSGSGANAGYVNFFDQPIWASDCSTIVPRDAKLSVDFVYKFLLCIQQHINTELRRGAAQPHVYPRDLAEIPMPLPPFDEQKRIVAMLGQAFAALDRARDNAAANLADVTNLYDGKLRKVFYEDLAGSDKARLPDICDHFGRGKSKYRPRNDPKLYGGDIPFVQTGDISRADHFIESYNQTYSEQGLAQSKLWPKGTVCIAIVGATIGETGILAFDACFPDSVIGICPNSKLCNAEYVELMLRAFKEDLKEAGRGSARDNINLGTFEDRLFPIPQLSVQLEIVETLSQVGEAARKLKDACDRKLQDIAALRQSLLQKAFAGEL